MRHVLRERLFSRPLGFVVVQDMALTLSSTGWTSMSKGRTPSYRMPADLSCADSRAVVVGRVFPTVNAMGSPVSIEREMKATLRDVFGFEDFRAGQEEAAKAVLAHRDVFVRMKTSGGKSLCFLLPAVMVSGITVVISPLISLMEDQVANLSAKGIKAIRVTSLRDSKVATDIAASHYKLVYMSPEAITSPFWRAAFSGELLKKAVSFIVVDEAHLVNDWGFTFRPAFRELSYLRSVLPVPIMALSATAPASVVSIVASNLCMHEPQLISGTLDRPNLFYSIDSVKSVASVFYLLSATLSSTSTLQAIPKTLVFCQSKDTLYTVYSHLVRSCNNVTERAVGQYHATMTTESRTRHYELFKSGSERVMVATSAFGLGIDIPDIEEVVLFGLPVKGPEFVQLAGRGGRDPRIMCLVRAVFKDKDLAECDEGLKKLATGNSCLRRTILYNILESDEEIELNDKCCSVCCATIRPRIFVPELTLIPQGPIHCKQVRTKRVSAGQKESLKRSLVAFRQTAGEHKFRMRGLDAILPYAVIDKLVKNCKTLCSERDLQLLGVPKQFSASVLKVVDSHVPYTVSDTVPSIQVSRPLRQAAARHVLADISNLSSLV